MRKAVIRTSTVLTGVSLAVAAIFGISPAIASAAIEQVAIAAESPSVAIDKHLTDVATMIVDDPASPTPTKYVLPRYHPKSFRFSSTPRKPRGLGSKSNRQIAGVKKRRAGGK